MTHQRRYRCRTEAIEIYEIKCDIIWSLNSLWECSFFKGGLHTSRCSDGVTASWKTRSFTIFYCKSVTASAFFSIYLLYATLQSFFLFLFHLCSLQSIFFSLFNAKICRKLNSIERGYRVQITGFFHKANTIWSFEVHSKILKVNFFSF